MTQVPISSIEKAGRFESIDDNFTELYSGVAAASASAAAAGAVVDAITAAWAAYAATATSASGSITTKTTTAAFIAIGKIIHFRTSTVVTTAGTGSGGLKVDLPATANGVGAAIGYGADIVFGQIAAASKQITIFEPAFSTPIHSGTTVVISGTYEKQ